MKRILRGIKPFNEFGLKSCYYNQLVTGYSTFGAEPRVVVADYLPLYAFSEESKTPLLNTVSVLDEKHIRLLTGVQRRKHACVKNIGKFIKEHIDVREPVILPVDCFFLPYRADMFGLRHEKHFLLVYGYDTDNKLYYIVDHLFRNSAEYRKQKISAAELERAYRGFSAHLADGQSNPVTVLRKDGAPQGDFGVLFRNSLLKKRKEIENSCRAFSAFFEYLGGIVRDKSRLFEQSQELGRFFSDLRWAKIVQKNVLRYVYRGFEAYSWADRISENCVFVFGVMTRITLRGECDEKSAEKLLVRLREICELEERLHRWLAEEA